MFMLEDALKRARQSYFLLLTIASITILFSFSIQKPNKLVDKKKIIEKLLQLDLNAYDLFVDQKINSKLPHDTSNFLNELDSLNFIITGVDKITNKLKNIDYSGRLYLRKSKFKDLSRCSFNDLITINSFSTSEDVKWFTPELDPLEKKIITFLTDKNQKSIKIDNISTTSGKRKKSDSTTYYALKNIDLTLDFTLDDTNTSRFSTPIFGEIVEIPNSSFEHWLTTSEIDSKLLKKVNNKLVWLEGGDIFDLYEKTISFKDLLPILKTKLEDYSSKKQSISFLGMEISGSFFFIVSPILLILLIYFHYSNLCHLSKLIDNNQDSIKEFSWTALNGEGILKHIEIFVVIFIFPLISFFILISNLEIKMFIGGITICMVSYVILSIMVIFKFKYLHSMM